MCIRDSIIGKQEITIKDGRLTPEALWTMGRIGSLSISPDGKKIAYTAVSYTHLDVYKRQLLNNDTALKAIFRTILEKTDKPIVAPLHTYVKNKLSVLDITSERLYILPPQPYLSFGYLVSHAQGLITDSGNVAEEATFLGIPCMTLSTYAEHPETVTIGTNRLVGEDPEILANALDMLNKGEWQKGLLPERWDGHTAERIVQTLLDEHK